MSDIDKIWREKSDEDLLEAAANLDDFTPDGQRVIREELRRRGMEDPVEQAGEANLDAGVSEREEAEPVAMPEPECLRCRAEMRFRGTRTLLGETGNLFANSEALDLYVCPKCGHAELFASEVTEEAAEE